MAFNFNAPAAAAPAGQTNDSWKATAFLNFYAKKPDGSRVKIGAIPLKQSKRTEAALIQRLSQEDGVAALMAALEIDFQLVDDGKPVELGF